MYNQNSMRRKQQMHKVERTSIVDSANNLSNSLVSQLASLLFFKFPAEKIQIKIQKKPIHYNRTKRLFLIT